MLASWRQISKALMTAMAPVVRFKPQPAKVNHGAASDAVKAAKDE